MVDIDVNSLVVCGSDDIIRHVDETNTQTKDTKMQTVAQFVTNAIQTPAIMPITDYVQQDGFLALWATMRASYSNEKKYAGVFVINSALGEGDWAQALCALVEAVRSCGAIAIDVKYMHNAQYAEILVKHGFKKTTSKTYRLAPDA